MYGHRFIPIVERYDVWELDLNDDSSGGFIDKLRKVFPPEMPQGHQLIYSWLPPRKDAHGQPIESARLVLTLVPVSKDGPMVSAVTRLLSEKDLPKTVREPEMQDIPPLIQSMTDDGDLEVFGARVGIQFPAGCDKKVKKSLLARACATSARARQVLDQMAEAASKAVRQPPMAQQTA